MWLLNQDQTARLVALQRSRDLQRLGAALAEAFPEARARLGTHWDGLLERAAERGAIHGLVHLCCLGRLLAAWIVSGTDLEAREPWAAALLQDGRRGEGAKAFQLCVRVLEQLRVAAKPGQPTADAFAAALRLLDGRLGAAGALGSLLPREPIRLGAACDLDAVELRVTPRTDRRRYTARSGTWQREPWPPPEAAVRAVHDPQADAPPAWPRQVNVLTAASGDAPARLRLRAAAEHRCDGAVHPVLQRLEAGGEGSLRGPDATDATFAVDAEPPPADGSLPAIGEEGAARFSGITIGSCGLRPHGLPIGTLSTLVAAYDEAQHFVAWRREPVPRWTLPVEPPPVAAEARCRRERDGTPLDTGPLQRGFLALDAQLQRALNLLFNGWERESGVSGGRLAIDAQLLAGTAAATWGWAERAGGIVEAPFMRLEALLDLVACRLDLSFGGVLTRAGSRSQLTLSTSGTALLQGPHERPPDAELFAFAAALRVSIRQRFELAVQPMADAGLAVLGAAGPVQGAIAGTAGLEQRPDGPGLRWFVRLAVEPVSAPLRVRDPLLGVQTLQQPLLPAQTLVDWSLA